MKRNYTASCTGTQENKRKKCFPQHLNNGKSTADAIF